MKKDLVKKSNSLNEAHYFLTVAEYRILHMAFSTLAECDVNPEFFRNVRFTIKAKDYMDLYGVDRATAYQALRDASERLFNRYFTYDELVNKDLMLYERIKSRWVTKIGYQDNQAYITFFLSDDVLSMVGNLKEQYTYLNLYKFADLTSIHAVRVYEMLMQWRKTKTPPMISLDELRLRLGLSENEYPRIYDFKKYVLDIAISQINKFTDISANYEQIKEGRKISGFKFKYKDKSKPFEQEPTRDKRQIDMFTGLTDQEQAVIQARIDEHIQRLESEGETVSDWHRKNIAKKAAAEKWGLDVFEKQQVKQEQKAKASAAKKAEQEQQEQKKQQDRQRQQALIETFESLPLEQQEFILDEVGRQAKGIFIDFFKRDRANNRVHKNPMFMSYFMDLLGLND